MKLVIIPSDGSVYVEGFSYSNLNLSFCPSDIHAVQWNMNKGWIEFKDRDDGTKPQNLAITELPSWALESKIKWDEAKAAEEAARLAAEEAARLAAEEAARLAAEEAAKNSVAE